MTAEGVSAEVMTRDPIRIAVIGQGFMGRAHSFGWARARSLEPSRFRPELTVLCGRDRAALAQNAASYGFAGWSDRWEEVVRRSDVDLVDICTPGVSHAEIALAALTAGKHVLCEKPLANSLEEAIQLAAAAGAAAARGVFAMVGFNYRRVPAIAAACRLIGQGRLGKLRHVRAAYLQDWLVDPSFPLTWRLDASQAGSGALGDLGSHVIDLVRFLSGEPITEVLGLVETFVAERPHAGSAVGLSATAASARARGRVTVDDACVLLARLGGGALATIEATRMAPGHKNALAIEINGTEGSLRFNLERLNELEVYEVHAPQKGFARMLVTEPDSPYLAQWWPPGHVLGWEHSFVHEFEDFLEAIAERRPPQPSFLDGLATQAVLDAATRSARSRTWIAVQDITVEDIPVQDITVQDIAVEEARQAEGQK
jgi:predicted dehydrogenase